MMITFYITDRKNRAMAFINNDITKALLLVMAILVIVESVYLIVHLRKKQYEEYEKHSKNKDN
jgi:fumarate reductase subunit D